MRAHKIIAAIEQERSVTQAMERLDDYLPEELDNTEFWYNRIGIVDAGAHYVVARNGIVGPSHGEWYCSCKQFVVSRKCRHTKLLEV